MLKFKSKGKNVRILNGFNIGHPEFFEIEDDVLIGLNSYINAKGGLLIKRGTVTGPNLMIYTVNHQYEEVKELPFDESVIEKKVIIGDNCWVGANVIILPGVEIGEGSVIAAGSVVTKSFESLSLIGGNPARLIKKINNPNYEILKSENKIHNYLNQ